ncbi:hypothetical protein DFS33DRAFT_521477 [Desarmillaria ectypa]|nr:hypothetical protein DFS33DRAFT_521477 [Desarmillaria ectypa]
MLLQSPVGKSFWCGFCRAHLPDSWEFSIRGGFCRAIGPMLFSIYRGLVLLACSCINVSSHLYFFFKASCVSLRCLTSFFLALHGKLVYIAFCAVLFLSPLTPCSPFLCCPRLSSSSVPSPMYIGLLGYYATLNFLWENLFVAIAEPTLLDSWEHFYLRRPLPGLPAFTYSCEPFLFLAAVAESTTVALSALMICVFAGLVIL